MNILIKLQNFWRYMCKIMSFAKCKKIKINNNTIDSTDIQFINIHNTLNSIQIKIDNLEVIVQSLLKITNVTNLSDNLQDDYVNIK